MMWSWRWWLWWCGWWCRWWLWYDDENVVGDVGGHDDVGDNYGDDCGDVGDDHDVNVSIVGDDGDVVGDVCGDHNDGGYKHDDIGDDQVMWMRLWTLHQWLSARL